MNGRKQVNNKRKFSAKVTKSYAYGWSEIRWGRALISGQAIDLALSFDGEVLQTIVLLPEEIEVLAEVFNEYLENKNAKIS